MAICGVVGFVDPDVDPITTEVEQVGQCWLKDLYKYLLQNYGTLKRFLSHLNCMKSVVDSGRLGPAAGCALY